jgi:hypothetical protein
MWSALGAILTTVGLGVVGWFVTHFFARHLLRFHQLRERVREEVFFTGNVVRGLGTPDAELRAAQDALRRLAAQFAALDAVIPSAIRALLRCWHYDVDAVTRAVTSWSNTIMVDARDRELQRMISRTALENALHFPRTYTAAVIEQARETAEARSRRGE